MSVKGVKSGLTGKEAEVSGSRQGCSGTQTWKSGQPGVEVSVQSIAWTKGVCCVEHLLLLRFFFLINRIYFFRAAIGLQKN